MIKLIKKITKKVFMIIYANIDHEGFARYIGVRMGKNCKIYGNPIGMFSTEPWLITIGDNVHITREVMFITHDGGTLILRKEIPDLELTSPIKVGNNVYIGVRSIILPGVKIGNKCIIAAGSIVTRDIPDNSVAAGVPARIIETLDEYKSKAIDKSLHLGHLSSKEKEKQLKNLFKTNGT